MIALACEPPSCDGRELTHWTLDDLAAAAVARDIVKCISAGSIGRFLREADLKPHRTRGWINTPRDEDFDETCQDVCETYRLAPERAAAGVETRSIDAPSSSPWRRASASCARWFRCTAHLLLMFLVVPLGACTLIRPPVRHRSKVA